MSDSILTSTKKILGVDESYTAFDLDIMTHINAVFSILTQLGIGPSEGFMIEDDVAEWADYDVGTANVNQIKTYVYLRVRLLFDPPQTSFLIESLERQFKELEWRLSINREGVSWTDPNEPLPEF